MFLFLYVSNSYMHLCSREEERVQNGAAELGPRRGDVRIMDCVRFFQLGGAKVTLLTVRCQNFSTASKLGIGVNLFCAVARPVLGHRSPSFGMV